MAVTRASGEEVQPFAARLPRDLHNALKERAADLGGASMNDVVVAALRTALEGAELAVVGTSGDFGDARLDLACVAVEGDIAALKGIARHYENLGRHNLSCVLYAAAARLVASSDPVAASRELVTTASQAQRRRRPELAKVLLRTAIDLHPTNLVAQNRLGQLLYFAGDFKAAVKYLAPVKERDNHARLFHGWSMLRLALDAGDRVGATRAREEIVAAMETWAFGERDPRARDSWLRQLVELDRLGEDYRQAVDELLRYANENSGWHPSLLRADFKAVSREPAGPDMALD
jgi:tetratricopeptide (TPR) repeat protein